MDENFITSAVQASGELGLVSVKVIKNRVTGEPASYGFINFDSDHNALLAMHRLNGKVIPNSSPAVRYKLNHGSTRLAPGERDFSLWVGDLSPDVDDLQLYKFFSARFQSVRTCKVVVDGSGFSKGYGFIRFGEEREHQSALSSMMGLAGLGAKPIKVSPAVPKVGKQDHHGSHGHHPGGGHHHGGGKPPAGAGPEASADYSQYWQSQYSQYWSQYAAWSQYSQYYDQQQQQQQPQYYPPQEAAPLTSSAPVSSSLNKSRSSRDQRSSNRSQNLQRDQNNIIEIADENSDDDIDSDEVDLFHGDILELVDHSPKLDYDKMNAKFLRQSEELWTAVESSFWWEEQEEGQEMAT